MSLEKENHLKQEDEKYSFKTLGGNSQNFYLTLDEKGEPIKLGDGTFGIVFAVHDSNQENRFAVKLLYAHKIDQSRFDNEIKSTQEISRAKGERRIFGVIRTVGWTNLFQESNVYKTLKVFFEPLKISNYALVTEKYDATLKDILERDGKQNQNIEEEKSQHTNAGKLTGYEILKSKNFEFRRTNNSLYRRNWEKENNSPTPSFLETLKELQNLDKDKLPARFVRGFWYLDKISELVNRSVQSSSSQNSFSFSELHPTNLVIRETNGEPENLTIRFQAYKTEEYYRKDLRSDSVYTKITRDMGNPFVPNYLAFLRRKIKIKELENKQYEYQFLDSSSYKNNIEKGDWIIIKPQNNTTNVLLQVESSEGSNLTYKHVSFEEDNNDEVSTIINNITNAEEDLEKLKRNITDFINSNEMQTVLLRSYLSDELLKEIPTLSQLINNSQIGVSLEFDKLTSSLVEVQSGNMTIRLDDMLTIM
jgi:hypothetical protein